MYASNAIEKFDAGVIFVGIIRGILCWLTLGLLDLDLDLPTYKYKKRTQKLKNDRIEIKKSDPTGARTRNPTLADQRLRPLGHHAQCYTAIIKYKKSFKKGIGVVKYSGVSLRL